MSTLSDTQLVILSAACAREDRRVLPLPKTLKGGAANKVIGVLLAKGLVAEIDALKGDPPWRDDGNGRCVTLVATPQADAALDGGPAEAAAPRRAARAPRARNAAQPQPSARKAKLATSAPATGKTRPGTKQARLIALLKRAKGASIAEIAQDLGWQHHTVHGAIAGALKKKLGLAIASETNESRGRVYRIME